MKFSNYRFSKKIISYVIVVYPECSYLSTKKKYINHSSIELWRTEFTNLRPYLSTHGVDINYHALKVSKNKATTIRDSELLKLAINQNKLLIRDPWPSKLSFKTKKDLLWTNVKINGNIHGGNKDASCLFCNNNKLNWPQNI